MQILTSSFARSTSAVNIGYRQSEFATGEDGEAAILGAATMDCHVFAGRTSGTSPFNPKPAWRR